MLQLAVNRPGDRPLSILAIGAHPDDIEIGAGGTLLQLAAVESPLRAQYVVMTGSQPRQAEARIASAAFLGSTELFVELHELPEGRLPAHWAEVKEVLEAVAKRFTPDLIFAPSTSDAHQDHRTIAEIVPTVFRNSLYLSYEIPKWDGDFWRPSVYVSMTEETAHRKVELLSKCFPSQCDRDWWGDETFLGLARLRGIECRASYAEGFGCTKSLLAVA
jgi:LmbE family N-acetylglucosaminyl deacetylase